MKLSQTFPASRYRILLFDLDGTLVDSQEGVTRSVQYALDAFGIHRTPEELTCFIGPPLCQQFMAYTGWDEAQGQRAVEKYRERYRTIGIYENTVYEGLPALLARLQQAGRTLAVATSKPETFAREILRHYQMDGYFDEITGSELDGRRVAKADVIEEALHRLGVGPAGRGDVLMIGDRRHDVDGAHACGIPCLGVGFGYAPPGELEQAGADFLAATVDELAGRLLPACDQRFPTGGF